MILLLHKVASWFLKRRMDHVEAFVKAPEETQSRVLQELTQTAAGTIFGRDHGFRDIRHEGDFRNKVPVSTYEQLYAYTEKALTGEADVLWPGKVEWFAKSSGTTNDRSKFIPITADSLEACHFRAGQDMLAIYLHNQPESKLFSGKSLSIGGSHTVNRLNEFSRCGDLSAVLMANLPIFYELRRTPSREVALMAEWEQKIEAMAREVRQEDITAIAGVPTWTLVLLDRLFEMTGNTQRNVLELWPNLELYVHGGVSFEPYREQFRKLIPRGDMTYLDCYNASEGFFAVQDTLQGREMLLMLDYGIFYEFLPMDQIGEPYPKTCLLHEVVLGQQYALVISTNGGLWRYFIGDTVVFTSLKPYRIRVSGRTKHFINAFGEELVVENADTAIAAASRATGAQVADYTAAPIYFEEGKRGGHEWILEFDQEPDNLDTFAHVLDATLREVNSDYDAKRAGDIALGKPTLWVAPRGTFYLWLKNRGKLGGQNKVPRLANNREYLDSLLALLADQKA